MIDILKAKEELKKFLDTYEDKDDISFKMKMIHTYHVADTAKEIAKQLNLKKEDIELAELIGLLHDIGRFEELKVRGELNNVKFDHAMCGSEMLFKRGLIRNFAKDNKYDEIIKKSIENHNKLKIESGLDERTLLHCKIIRDADKLDNYRVNIEKELIAILPKQINKTEDMEESLLTEKVYQSALNETLVDIHDRVTPLDFWVSILAFTFDINFDVSYKIIKENNYINRLVDRFDYKDKQTKEKMEIIRNTVNDFVDKKLNGVI